MEYEATGEIRLGGCAGYLVEAFLYYDFEIGSIVFNKDKAVRGVYERVVIKDVRFPKTYTNHRRRVCKHCDLKPLYVDTLNALWNEEDLISYDQAQRLVSEWQLDQAEMLEIVARKCIQPHSLSRHTY